MRVETCALLVVGTLLSVPAFAQVSFSGDWIALDEAASIGASYLSPLGDKGSIVQANGVITFRTVDGELGEQLSGPTDSTAQRRDMTRLLMV